LAEILILNKYTEPHIADSALITIDTQNDFTLDGAPARIAGTKDIIPSMARLLECYRRRRLLIIHVVRFYLRDGSNVDACRRQAIEEGNPIVVPGTDGANLVAGIEPEGSIRLRAEDLIAGKFQQIADNEYVMYKPRWGAFYGTRLEWFLKKHNRNTLVFCGCNYPNCPRTSVYQASERDFRIVLVTDAMSQWYAKAEEEMKNIAVALLTTKDMKTLLG